MAGIASKFGSITLIAPLLLGSVLLSACSNDEESDTTAETPAAASSSEAPTFEAKDVPVKKVDDINKVARDDGLNVNMEILYTAANTQGSGAVIYVLLTNRNEMPLPADAIAQPTLKVGGSDIAPVSSGTTTLDLPLAPGASMNLAYAFDTTYYSLSDATFTIGNLEFTGNLNSID